MIDPQPMERAHYWYYMLELGFYGSLLLRISVDVKRKVSASYLIAALLFYLKIKDYQDSD